MGLFYFEIDISLQQYEIVLYRVVDKNAVTGIEIKKIHTYLEFVTVKPIRYTSEYNTSGSQHGFNILVSYIQQIED